MVSNFKKGDWVIVLGINHTRNNEAFPKNSVFRIDKIAIDSNLADYIYVDKDSTAIKGTCTGSDCIRFALPEEIPLEHRNSINSINHLYLW